VTTLGYVEGAATDFGHALTAGSLSDIVSNLADMYGNEAGAVGSASAAGTSNVLKTLTGMSLGDMTLIAVGIILAIGALLISQKETVVKVGDLAAKAGSITA
jgi:hypothetical protein